MHSFWVNDFLSIRIRKFFVSVSTLALGVSLAVYAKPAYGMDLQTAVEIALQSNPEIAEASANRRAIDFEYEQARRLNRPSLILEGRVGPELVSTATTRLIGNDDDVLFGRQASATIQQNLLSFGRNNAERDRQASRVDAAAHRVLERSELVSLDVVQAYLDVMRLREIVDFADQNVAFHENKVNEISRGVSGGIKSAADEQQARERLSAAKISRSETEEALDIAGSDFRRVVGRNIGQTQLPDSILSKIPSSLAEAIGTARKNNPTLQIANADLDTVRAEYRQAKANRKPELLFEVVGRAGDNISGFRERTNDVRAQVSLRYEFRGGIKSSVVQEQINRVDEARARIMTLERNVESLVYEAWSTRNRTSRRVIDLQTQVSEGANLLDSYTREFDIGRRTLLDILDAEASLFQAQTSMSTAKFADLFAQYRLLAATGNLLDAFGVNAPREADASLRALEKVEPTPLADTEPRRYTKSFDPNASVYTNVVKTDNTSITTALTPKVAKSVNLVDVDVRPITRQTATPAQAKEAMAVIDALIESDPVRSIADDQKIASLDLSVTPEGGYKTLPTTETTVEIYDIDDIAEASFNPSRTALEVSSKNTEESFKPNQHIVVEGDTLYSIAMSNNITVAELKRLNNIKNNHIQIGQTLEHNKSNQEMQELKTHNESVGYIEPYYVPSGPVVQVESSELPTQQGGVPEPEHEIIKVDRERYEALMKQDGARLYPGLGAVLLDKKMYLADN